MPNHHNLSNGNIQSSLKEVDEEFYSMGHQDIDSGSKCLPAHRGSAAGTDALDGCEATEDIEELKQRVKNMQSELEKYRVFLLQLQGSDQLLFTGVSSGVVSDAALPVEGFVTQDTAMEGVQTSSGVPQLSYEIHTKTRDSESVEAPDAWAAQNLQELLLASKAELDREQVVNVHPDEMYPLQNSLRAASPSR